MESRVLIARLRAVEEGLKRDLDDMQAVGYGVEDDSKDGRFLAGYVAATVQAIGRIKRLREYASADLARSVR